MLARTVPPFRAILPAFALVLGALAAPAAAQSPAATGDYQPSVGQSGKDVIWVPTPEGLVDRMLRMARVGAGDFVIDLGAGDGRIAIAAAQNFRARARGIEFNPDMVALARRKAQAAGVASTVEFLQSDLFTADLGEATVITMYLLPSINLKLRPRLLELNPGTRIVSHAFDMGDWDADETSGADRSLAYLWVVPAQAGGTWKVEHPGPYGTQSFEMILRQKYQRVEGTVRRGTRLSPVTGILQGDRLRFTVADAEEGDRVFTGRVAGGTITGQTRTQGGTEIGFKAGLQ